MTSAEATDPNCAGTLVDNIPADKYDKFIEHAKLEMRDLQLHHPGGVKQSLLVVAAPNCGVNLTDANVFDVFGEAAARALRAVGPAGAGAARGRAQRLPADQR